MARWCTSKLCVIIQMLKQTKTLPYASGQVATVEGKLGLVLVLLSNVLLVVCRSRVSLHPLEADSVLPGRLPHRQDGRGDLRHHQHEAQRQEQREQTLNIHELFYFITASILNFLLRCPYRGTWTSLWTWTSRASCARCPRPQSTGCARPLPRHQGAVLCLIEWCFCRKCFNIFSLFSFLVFWYIRQYLSVFFFPTLGSKCKRLHCDVIIFSTRTNKSVWVARWLCLPFKPFWDFRFFIFSLVQKWSSDILMCLNAAPIWPPTVLTPTCKDFFFSYFFGARCNIWCTCFQCTWTSSPHTPFSWCIIL